MASTYSPSLGLELMATGDQSGTWGDTTNTNLGTLLEQAITGVLSVAQGDTTLTLTDTQGASNQARNAVINLTGALTASRNVIVPAVEKLYVIKNSTTGGYSIVVKTSGGAGVTVLNSQSRFVYCDGTDVLDALSLGTIATQSASNVAITAGTITGLTSLTLASGVASPATNDAAALGTTSLMWSDLFLASGGVINWNNGDVTITHSSNTLAFAGAASGYTFDAPINKVTITAPATGATLTLADGKTLTVSNTLTLAGTDSTTMTFPSTSSTVLTTGNTATITKGYSVTPGNLGTVSSGTVTPSATDGNYQYLTNNGAFTLVAPATDCAIALLVTNAGSAGAITFSGFTVGSATGSPLTTTNGNKFRIMIERINSVAYYSVYALQ